MAREDYYSLLGIDRQAPEREVKRAYYNLARDLHPDKAKSPEEARENAERLAVISKAYNTLKDPQKRAEYDASNKGGGTPPAKPSATSGAPAPKATAAPAASPSAPAAATPAPAAAPRLSANDIQGQRVLTAQKAFVKGMEFYKNTDFKKALPFFEAAVEHDPDGEAQYHMRLAVCLLRTKGSFTRALAAAEKAVAMDAYNVEFKHLLGEVYEAAGVMSKAQTVYEDILKWEPENAKAKTKIQLLKSAKAAENPSVLAKVFPSIFGKK